MKRLVLAGCWALAGQGAGGGAPAVRGIGMHGGRRYLEELLAVVDALPAGLTELIVHPGRADPETLGLDPYDAPRELELSALLSGRLRERFARGDLALAAFDAGAGSAA